MKKEYLLSQQFALIALDGLSCIHHSAAKYAAARGIAAAVLLEEILPEEEAVERTDIADDFQKKLEVGIAAVRRKKKKKLDALEAETARLLVADGGMEIVPDLLGCDMNYYTAKITMKSYRSDRNIYLSIVESVRGEILEEGPVTLECVCLLWLMRESGCLHDIFSVKEQEQIQERMVALCARESRKIEAEELESGEQNTESMHLYDARDSKKTEPKNGAQELRHRLTDADYAAMIWKLEFHKTAEQAVKSFLKGKRKLFQNPYLEGVNLRFPFLDRRQAIFVDFVVLGTNVKERRQAVANFLKKNGHHVEEVKNGTETLLRIDNSYYRIWPKTVSCGRIPIQGANLQPVYR